AVSGACNRIIKIRHITRCVDPWSVSFQPLVDEDAVVYLDAAIVKETDFWVNTDSDCDKIAGHNFAAVRHDGFDPCCAGKLFDLFSENQLYAAFSKIFGEEFAGLARAQFLVDQVLFRDQRCRHAPCNYRRSKLHSDEARSYYDRTPCMQNTLVQ